MAAETPAPKQRGDAIMYWTIAIVLVGLLVAGVIIYRSHRSTREANAKAAQLIRELELASLPAPANTQSVAAVLGTDGGAVCESPTDPLVQGLLSVHLSNGAATVGMRPVVVDRVAVQGEEAILRVYCPDKLPKFREYVNEQKYSGVIER